MLRAAEIMLAGPADSRVHGNMGVRARGHQYEVRCVVSEALDTAAHDAASSLEAPVHRTPRVMNTFDGQWHACTCPNGVCDPLGRAATTCTHVARGEADDLAHYDVALFSCSDACSCTGACPLRRVGGGVAVAVAVAYIGSHKGWGLLAAAPIPRGAFVCEYVGERVLLAEARRRWHDAATADTANYVLCLREHL